ncbi:serine-rich adhesin for platelets isoform X2 [Eurosta solidaginis]|uniref:serine-rich adhesin for platelets isoform X2 n=1 Tax=Eurosta solidaginis TaxID=178769 RepID=UPI003530CF71
MRKPKTIGFINYWMLIVALARVCVARGIFEDAEISDYASDAYPLFKLRHTIPGEPEVDYPILNEVPKTGFKCTGRHEGYYADLETRCQVFRICAHTARSVNGFSFLCPNGTLFSQKNFVCDWYRNVNCEESEQYYYKNNANKIGSNTDMMQKVRQMMEYPIKTILQALETKGPQPQTPRILHHTHKKQLESGLDVSEVDGVQQSSSNREGYQEAVTSTQLESSLQNAGYNEYTHKDDSFAEQYKITEQQHTETISTSVDQGTQTNNGEIYINSLGELSSDPGVDFVHDMARIIAEPPGRTNKADKSSNIVGEIVVGVNKDVQVPSNLLVPPEFMKTFNHRQTNDEFVLASNINNLLNDVAEDLQSSPSETQMVSPQKKARSFRFLSRGFTSQSEGAKKSPYQYGKPKQAASTVRLSTNEIPFDDSFKPVKASLVQAESLNLTTSTEGNTNENSDEVMQFTTTVEASESNAGFSNAQNPKNTKVQLITNTTSESTSSDAPHLNNFSKEPNNFDHNYLNLPTSENREKIETTADTPTFFEFENFKGNDNVVKEVPKGISTKPQLIFDTTTARASLILAKEANKTASITDAIPTPAKLLLPPDTPAPAEEHSHSSTNPTIVDEDKLDAEVPKGISTKPQLIFDTTTARASLILAKEANKTASITDAIPTPAKLFLPPDTPAPAEEHSHSSTYPTIADEDKLDADHHAATLLIAGVKLTTHNNNGDKQNVQKSLDTVVTGEKSSTESEKLMIHVEDEATNALHNSSDIDTLSNRNTTTITTTAAVHPDTNSSFIDSLSEANNFKERIRSYRRFSTQHRHLANILSKEKDKNDQEFEKTKTEIQRLTSSSTTTTSTPITRSYLKRVSANRLRLSRLTATTNHTSSSDVANSDEDSLMSREKVATRNIYKDVSIVDIRNGNNHHNIQGNSFPYADTSSKRRKLTSEIANESARGSSGAKPTEKVRSGLKRVQTSRKLSTDHATTTNSHREVTKVTHNISTRRLNRYSNFKPSEDDNTAVITAATSTTTEATIIMTSSTEKAQTTYPTSTTPLQSVPDVTEAIPHNLQTQSPEVSFTSIPTTSSFNLLAINNSELHTNAIASKADQPQNDFLSTEPSSSVNNNTAALHPSLPTSTISFSSSSPNSSNSSGSSIASSNDASTFIDFTELTHAIADDSVLQNFHATPGYLPVSTAELYSLSVNKLPHDAIISQSHTSQYNKLPAQAPSQLIPPPRPEHLPQVFKPHTPTSPSPRIVIAPAVGQRIAPNSFASVISALVTQPSPKATPSTSYLPLDDFLTKKFGRIAETKDSTSYVKEQQRDIYSSSQQPQFYQTPKTNVFVEQQKQQFLYKQQQLEQLHQYQQQQYQQRNPQQSYSTHFSNIAAKLSHPPQQQYVANEIYNVPQQSVFAQAPSVQQQQHLLKNQQFSQQKYPYLPFTQEKYHTQQTSPTHFYFPKQQQQQQSAQIASQVLSANRQHQQRYFNTAPQFNILKYQSSQYPPFNDVSNNDVLQQERDIHLNIQLPAVTPGLIPAPIAQRRVDVLEDAEPEISDDQQDTNNGSYSGKSSYDVPLSSIGRLPNDITHLLRRLRSFK